MIRVASRTPLHDAGDVREAVVAAVEMLDEIGLNDDDRAALLPAVAGLLAQRHVELEQIMSGAGRLLER